MVYVSTMLFIRRDIASAKKVMFSSYFYLMIVFLSLYANKRDPQIAAPSGTTAMINVCSKRPGFTTIQILE